MEVDGGEWERDENEVEQKGSQMQGSNIQLVKELLSTEAIKHHLMHVLVMSYFGCPPPLQASLS